MRKNRLAFDVYGCKIRRADLHDLWQLCTKDFEKPSAILTVEDGISEIRSESLDSILEELGNPPRLSNLKINVSEAGDPLAESKGVWIDVDWHEVSVSVTGSDATWVRGRSEEIKAVLRQSRMILHPSWMFAMYASGLVFLASLYGPLFVISGVAGVGEVAVSFGGSIVLTVAVLVLLLRLGKTWISLSDSAKSPLSRADKISVAVLIVAVVTVGIIAYQTWGT